MQAQDSSSTALVTGASGGIGEAICRKLIAQGYRVVATARRLKNLQSLAAELGPDLQPVQLDVNHREAVTNLLAALPAGFAQIDVLINNAGHDTGGRRPFTTGDADQWCAIIETNVQGMIRVSHALIKDMLARGRGHIINLGSIAGIKPYATGSAYVASKYAVHGFSETLRLECAGSGVRVTEIMPGLVRSGFAAQRLGDLEAAGEFYAGFDACLMPDDIAETVHFALKQPAHVEISQLVVLPVSGP